MTDIQVEEVAALKAEISELIAECGAPDTDHLDDFVGPFGATLAAITIYRALSLAPESADTSAAMAKTARLIVLYAHGIVAGNGAGISGWPDQAES